MKKVNFIEVKHNGYYEYHLPCKDGLLEDSLFYKKVRLRPNLITKWYEFLREANITQIGSNENSLLYALIVRALSQNDDIGVVKFGNVIDLKKSLNPLEIKEVNWKFSFEPTIDDDGYCSQFGYQMPIEFLNEMNYSNKDLSNRGFYISKLRCANIGSFIKSYNSDVSSWSFTLNTDLTELLKILQKEENRPEVSEIVRTTGCIINVQIGGDEGYLDYVLIQSNRSLRIELDKVEDVIFKFGEEYERLLAEFDVIDEENQIQVFKDRFESIYKAALR